MPAKTFKATIGRDPSKSFIVVPFDPKAVFGKARAPVTVTVNGVTFRSTIAPFKDGPLIPLRQSNRDAAGIKGGETVEVHLELDTAVRDVKVPPDLAAALKKTKGAAELWSKLSYSHRREHVDAIESAKKPETRARRVEAALRMVLDKTKPAR